MIKFFRAIKTAFQYLFRNFGLSFASIIVMTLTFTIVSVVGLIFFGSYKLVKYVDSQPPLTIYLRGDLDEKGAKKFTEIVNSSKLAKEVDIKDIDYSKNDFVKKYPQLKDKIHEINSKSAFPIITFTYANSQDDLEKLIKLLENNEEFINNLVDTRNLERKGWYSFDDKQAKTIRETYESTKRLGIIITVILFVISSILIFITIKLTIQYHKKELEIMNLVGADGWFIKLPFIVDGIIYGVVGGLLSLGILFLIKYYIAHGSNNFVPDSLENYFVQINWPALDTKLILLAVGGIALVGGLVGAISSFFAIIRYVKK